MANDEDLNRLRQGPAVWNVWRTQNPDRCVDLGEADLSYTYLGASWPLGGDYHSRCGLHDGADLRGADFSRADLRGANLSFANLSETYLSCPEFRADLSRVSDLYGANLSGAQLWEANLRDADLHGMDLSRAFLSGASLTRANLSGAHLYEANLNGAMLSFANLSFANLSRASLSRAHLYKANLNGADLNRANLSFADLSGADLNSTILIETNLTDADLTGCRVYRISAWNVKLDGAKQRDLVITRVDEPQITVDNIEVGQFIYLLLHNEKIRDVINTITSKVVLILGRFTMERKAVLDALRNILREQDRTPVVFDFDVPSTKNLTDTVKLLAQLARYIIVDLSDPNSAPYELAVISMLGLKTTPVVPIIVSDQKPFPMLEDVLQERWSTDLITYQDLNDLITNLGEKLLKPAEAKVRELRGVTPG